MTAKRRGGTRDRSGYTLLELILSLAVVTILMGAMTSTVLVATRSLTLGVEGPDARVPEAARLVEGITADLRLALGFAERGPNAVEFTVPDRDGDGLPERVSYAWSGEPGFVLTRQVVLSQSHVEPEPLVIAEDVRQFDLDYLLRAWGPPPPPPALVSDEMILQRHDEVPVDGPVRVLLVVTSAASPTAGELERRSLLESWGHTVTLIGSAEPQASFDAAVAGADVAYVAEPIDSSALAGKLRKVPIAVVNEEVNSVDDLGLADAFGFPPPAATVELDVPSHYVTSALGLDRAVLFFTAQPITALDADPLTRSPDLEVLGAWDGTPALAVMEAGGELLGPGGGASAVMLVVANAASLTAQESLRRTLLESWGYDVVLIGAAATHAAFDAAAQGVDAAYICAGVDPDEVGTKLTWLTIGIVSELIGLTTELGLANGTAHTASDQDLVVLDNTHYITAPFDADEYEIFSADVEMAEYPGNTGAAVILGELPDQHPTLATLEVGAPLKGIGGFASGRRVFLPWGGPDVDIGRLEDEGLTIMRRAVEWAAAPPPAGFETVFPNQTGNDFDEKHIATRVTFPADARVTGISAYVHVTTARDMRYGIYSDEAGVPGRLLAQTDKKKPATGTGWRELELSQSVDLLAGTYWLALGMHDAVAYVYDDVGGQTRHADSGSDPHDGLMEHWAGTYESSTRRLSIYARYTPVELAPARRVQLPFAATGFDVGALSDAGSTLVQRAVQWAADVEDPHDLARITDKQCIAQYILPPLPENALEWSITRLYVAMRSEGKIDGDVIFELQHADGAMKPSGQVIAASAPVNEAALAFGGFRWYQVPLPAVEDLNPEYGVCVVVRATKKDAAVLKLDRVGAFATAGSHYVTSDDSGATWSAPNEADDLRFYLLGTYSTYGEPQWP